MPTSAPDPTGNRQTTDVVVAMQTWRATHPRASLKEIEQEVDRQLAVVRAAIITATAASGPEEERPPCCPDCGGAMQWDGERTRRLTTTHNEAITLTRRYARCPICGSGLFPPR